MNELIIFCLTNVMLRAKFRISMPYFFEHPVAGRDLGFMEHANTVSPPHACDVTQTRYYLLDE